MYKMNIMNKSKRLKAVNYEIYDQKELERYNELKDYSGIRSDSEFVRWSIKQLSDRINRDEEILVKIRTSFYKELDEIKKE